MNESVINPSRLRRLIRLRRLCGNRKFWKSVLTLALPIALQNLLTSSFSLVDTVMLGSLGEVALSSVGMAGQWSWLLNLVLFGFNSGASIFIAQYWGIRDIRRIHNAHGLQLCSVVPICALFTAVALLLPKQVVSIFNSDPVIVESGASYLRIAAFSYIAIGISNCCFTLLRSTETVTVPMAISGFSTVANAVLNYVLIYGKLGLPALGIRGAAVATVISSWMSPLLLLLWTVCKKGNLLRISPLKMLRGTDRSFALNYYKISSPVLINETLWGLGTVILNIVYGQMGAEWYSAITIEKTVDNVFFSFFVGLCGACTVFVGKSVGAGFIVRAKRESRRFLLLVPTLTTLFVLFIIPCRSVLVEVFNLTGSLSAETQRLAEHALVINALFQYIRLMPYMFIVGIFRSGGDTLAGLIFEICTLWMLSIPLTYLSAFVWKLPFESVFLIMLSGEDVVKTILCLHRYRSGKWIRPVTGTGTKHTES